MKPAEGHDSAEMRRPVHSDIREGLMSGMFHLLIWNQDMSTVYPDVP